MLPTGTPRTLVLALLVFALWSFFATYLWLDRMVSASYAADSLARTATARDQLSQVVLKTWLGRSRNQVKADLQAIFSDDLAKGSVLKDEGEELRFDDIVFVFQSGRLAEVRP